MADFSDFYGIGRADYSFLTVSSDSGNISYVPFNSIDELVVGIGESGFMTSASKEEHDIIRAYDLKEKVYRVIVN